MNRAWLFLLFLLATSLPAQAEDKRSPDVLAKEVDRALGLAQQGKLKEASSIWRDVLDELPETSRGDVHVNLAVAYKGLGFLPEAWYHLDAYLKTTKEKDGEVEKERASVEAALVKTHVPLRFSCDTPGTSISIDGSGQDLYPCPLRWWFKRGTEGTVVASAPGHLSGETPIRAHELDRDRRILVTTLEAEPPTVIPEKPVAVPLVAEKPQPRTSGQAWKWSLVGGGAALVLTGVVLQVVAYNKDHDLQKDYPGDVTDFTEWQANQKGYQDGFNNDVKPLAYGAYAMYGIGGAAAATGLVFLIADWSRPAVSTIARVRPLMARDVLGMTIDLDF